MASVAHVLDIARSQIGTREAGSNLTKYGAWYGFNGVPWCAIFLSWVLGQAGMGNQYRNASVAYSLDTARKQGRHTFDFRPGYIACRIHNGGWWGPGHTGIVEAVHADGTVTTIDGNSSNGVYRRRNSRGYWNRQCIRIDYSGGTSPGVPLPPPPKPVFRYRRPFIPTIEFKFKPLPSIPQRTINYIKAVEQGPTYPPPPMSQRKGYDWRVQSFQQKLKSLGWNILPDGFFGPGTHHVVVKFQRSKRLTANGIVGPVTWHAIWHSSTR